MRIWLCTRACLEQADELLALYEFTGYTWSAQASRNISWAVSMSAAIEKA